MKTTLVIKRALASFWWIPLIVGVLSLGLGIWTFCEPAVSMMALAYIFSAGLCIAGVLNLVFAVSVSGAYSGWGWSLCVGLLDLIAGIWLFCMPSEEMMLTFVFVVGIWIMVVAVNELCQSFMLAAVSPWWIVWNLLLLISVIVIACIFLMNPVEGGVIVWLWLGISLILYGVYRIVLACQLRSLGGKDSGYIAD